MNGREELTYPRPFAFSFLLMRNGTIKATGELRSSEVLELGTRLFCCYGSDILPVLKISSGLDDPVWGG
jgi:hypothetical protein